MINLYISFKFIFFKLLFNFYNIYKEKTSLFKLIFAGKYVDIYSYAYIIIWYYDIKIKNINIFSTK